MAVPQTFSLTGIFLSGSSFTGKYTIPISPSAQIILQSVVTECERKTIMKLLGVELGTLLIAYKEAQPNSDPPIPRYDDLIAPFDLQNENGISSSYCLCNDAIHSSLGIEDFLAAVVYFHFMKDDQIKASQSGQVMVDVETGKVMSANAAARKPESKWNAALDTSDAIQWFCRWKSDDTTGERIYPEFRGMTFPPQSGSVL